MIEKTVTSRMRARLLNLFLTYIDDRYYLRELERKLDESLSPLRRQLMKLVKMGILTRNIRYIANLVSDKTMEVAEVAAQNLATPTRPDRMVSRKRKIFSGNVPVLSSGETGERKSEEL